MYSHLITPAGNEDNLAPNKLKYIEQARTHLKDSKRWIIHN